MGLTVAVGLFSQNIDEAEEDDSDLDEPFAMINEVLADNHMAAHHEPRAISHDDYFESQMWGYNGLHALRRAASYLALENRLPVPVAYASHSDDPIYVEFNKRHEQYVTQPANTGLLSFLRKKPTRPAFQHLIMHSDAEGFYLPLPFDDVLVDWTQRLGLGMMIGSTEKLLEECRSLAKALEMPDGFDPEADEFLDILQDPPAVGTPWQILPVEAHAAATLIAACEVSLRLKAAIQFC